MKKSLENNLKSAFEQDFKAFKSDQDSLKGELKKNLFYKNYFDANKKVKKASIIPFIELIPGAFLKVAAAGLMLLGCYTSLKMSMNDSVHYEEKLQFVDTSFNGFDTTIVNQENFFYR